MPRNADFIRRRRIPLIWYYTQLTPFVVRGPRASDFIRRQLLTLSEDVESS